MYACLGVTCHLHFWQGGRGLLRATAVTRGQWNGHRRRVNIETKKVYCLEKKNLPPLLPGLELATFRPRVRRFTNKLSRLPFLDSHLIFNDKSFTKACQRKRDFLILQIRFTAHDRLHFYVSGMKWNETRRQKLERWVFSAVFEACEAIF